MPPRSGAQDHLRVQPLPEQLCQLRGWSLHLRQHRLQSPDALLASAVAVKHVLLEVAQGKHLEQPQARAVRHLDGLFERRLSRFFLLLELLLLLTSLLLLLPL